VAAVLLFAQHLAAHIFGIELLNIDFNMGARDIEQLKV